MADDQIYKCDLCNEKFCTLEELKKHKFFEHNTNTILQDNYVGSTFISSNNENQIASKPKINSPEFSKTFSNTNNGAQTNKTEHTSVLETPRKTTDVILNEKPQPTAPLLPSNNEYVITQQPSYIQQAPHVQQPQRTQQSSVCFPDPCCTCCCQPSIHCDTCHCSVCNDTNDGVDGSLNASNHCCCCGLCENCDCDCGDCDCDCGDCNCDCGDCNCDCGDCTIM